jgi:hypothetical protein
MPIDIQWQNLAQPDFAGNAISGYKTGKAVRKDQDVTNALGLYSTDPDAAIRALMPVDPGAALTLRKSAREDKLDTARTTAATQYGAGDTAGAAQTALGAGDFDMAGAITKLDKDQRDLAKSHAEQLGGFAQTLKGLSYEDAKARITAATPALLKQGFKPQEIMGFDPTPQNIDAIIGQAIDLKTALDHADKVADNTRADRQLSETQRHNKTSEGISSRNASTSAFSAQTGRMSFSERKKAGGFGTPGAGGKVLGADLDPNDGW